VTDRGTFVRVMQRILKDCSHKGQQGLDVGDKVRVRLIRTDAQRGYLDFARA